METSFQPTHQVNFKNRIDCVEYAITRNISLISLLRLLGYTTPRTEPSRDYTRLIQVYDIKTLLDSPTQKRELVLFHYNDDVEELEKLGFDDIPVEVSRIKGVIVDVILNYSDRDPSTQNSTPSETRESDSTPSTQNCTPSETKESSTEDTTKVTNKIIAGCRLELRAFSYPHTYDIVYDSSTDEFFYPSAENTKFSEDEINVNKYELDPNDTIVTVSDESTSLRLYFVPDGTSDENDTKGKWYVSTFKRIDAYQSRWSDNFSFGRLFQEIWSDLEIKWEDLDRNVCYILGMSHPQTKIIYDVPKPKLTLTGAWNLSDSDYFIPPHVHVELPGLSSRKSYKYDPKESFLGNVKRVLSLLEEAEEAAETCSSTKETGLFFFDVHTQRSIKVVMSEYHSLKKLRGNYPNVMHTYLSMVLECLHSNTVNKESKTLALETTYNDLKILENLYPEKDFTEIKRYAYNYSKLISQAIDYIAMRRNHGRVFIPKFYHLLLSNIPEAYTSTSAKNDPISLSYILDALRKTRIKHVYNELKSLST